MIQKALQWAPYASPNEQAYIYALAHRYSKDPNLDKMELRKAYRQAMLQVHQSYPEDLDAATLYAESILDLDPWHWWSAQKEPAAGTLEAVEVLESVLKKDPEHLGANHYYIHAIEGSKHPEYALISAYRLETLLPAGGHILHMPSHIYFLVGDYAQAAQSNKEAIKADWDYIKQFGVVGNYPVHYLSHNYYFLVRALMMEGKYREAWLTALELEQFYIPHFKQMPELENYSLSYLQVLLVAHQFDTILQLPPPPRTCIY